MARRNHFANDPSEDRGPPLTPQALSKQEFGRRLQELLNERNWSQSDLHRRTKEVDQRGVGIGRDAVSTYINGQSFPTPRSLKLLCEAMGLTRSELLPNSVMNAVNDEHPAFEMKVAPGHPDKAWVRVNRMMSFDTGAAIATIINAADKAASE